MSNKKENYNHPLWWYLLLYLFIGAAAGFMCVLMTGCSPRIVEKVVTQVEYHDRIVHDTTTFEVPVEVEKIVTRDTLSHLENNWAKSDAVVSDGFLHHSLESKPQVIKVPVEVHVTDTLWKEQEIREVEKLVEKELTWWQRFRLGAFPWLLLAVAVLLLFAFRKFIFKI